MLSKINVDKFNTFIEINALINSNYQDLNSLLIKIVDSAKKLCGGEAASLMLVSNDRKELHFEVTLGPKNEEVKKFTVKMGEGIVGFLVNILPELKGVQRGVVAMSLIRIGEPAVAPLRERAAELEDFGWVANYLISEINA